MLELVISGGQTGADQAGWRAAKGAGLVTGGWMTKGFLTEDGPRPEFAELYGAKEHKSPKYPPRSLANAEWAGATFIFETAQTNELVRMSRGTQLVTTHCIRVGRPSVIVSVRLAERPEPKRPVAVADWFRERNVSVLNVAGNRESKAPGIGAWVEEYLSEVFRLLRETSAAS